MRIPSRVYENLLKEIRDRETIRSMQYMYLSLLLGVLFILGVIASRVMPPSDGTGAPSDLLYILTAVHGMLLLFALPLINFVRRIVWNRLGEIRDKSTALEAVRSGLLSTIAVGEGLAFFGSAIVLLAAVQSVLSTAPWLWGNLISPLGFIGYALTHMPTTDRVTKYVRTHFSRV